MNSLKAQLMGIVLCLLIAATITADPVDGPDSPQALDRSVLDSCKSLAITEYDTYSEATRADILGNIDHRVTNLLENRHLLEPASQEALLFAYETYPVQSPSAIEVIEMLELVFWLEEAAMHRSPSFETSVTAYRWLDDRPNPGEDDGNTLGAGLEPAGGPLVTIDDIYFQESGWYIIPYPEPQGTRWQVYWRYTLANQNVGLIFRSEGPYTYVDVSGVNWDYNIHEDQYNSTVGTHTDLWWANLNDNEGNYTTDLSFEIWWDRTWPIPNEKLTSAIVTFYTDTGAPVTTFEPLPAETAPGTVTLNWSGSDDVQDQVWLYNLQYRIDNGSWQDFAPTTATTFDIPVTAGRTYYFQCRAMDRFGDPGFVNEVAVRDRHTETFTGGDGDTYTMVIGSIPPPPAPVVSEMEPCPYDMYTVSWDPVTGAERYELYENWLMVYEGQATDLTHSRPTGDYVYSVKACNASECSPYSFTALVSVLSMPDQPSLLSPADNAEDIEPPCFLQWTALDGTTVYRTQVADNPAFSNPVFDTQIGACMCEALNLEDDKQYYWRVCGCCECGLGEWSETWTFFTGPQTDVVEVATDNRPEVYALSQNYPNPFNMSTTIQFQLPRVSLVAIDIYNVLGQKTRSLYSGELTPGIWSVTWDGRDTDNREVASGMYFYRLRTSEFVETKKLILMK